MQPRATLAWFAAISGRHLQREPMRALCLTARGLTCARDQGGAGWQRGSECSFKTT